ncbi:MAG: DUF554 domain-containing protein [Deltaproteobacteria bacterium HGW-Deltaproteobacteria-8]|jgi:hypothetical protein|nr:MAG: DUF554 domain-containing protein [Deltaproteobacteria bacterium HGW-Deltaproteobacteria-8]
MLGPLVNSVCIVIGSVVGSFSGSSITPAFRTKFMHVFSCIALGIGVVMTAKANALPSVIAALLFGTLLGEAIHLEAGIMRAASWLAGLFPGSGPQPSDSQSSGLPAKVFRDQFAVATVLFCFSGLGIMGSMREGMTGDSALLFAKALLDLPTAMLFASGAGAVMGALAVPQFLLQMCILLAAQAVVPLTTPAMVADFTACGGIIMLGTGLRMCGLLEVPILSMLPSLFLVMPITALWTQVL